MPKIYSASEVGEVLGIPHLEVIRRIRRGDIEARKLGWNYVIMEDAIQKARNSDWYKKRIARQRLAST